ncbi:MAG: hypothetical protein JO061_08405 [Acidobacteriaceae bacterium]|nr:hypothetical protein [Acidobacteriaceae bacterium]
MRTLWLSILACTVAFSAPDTGWRAATESELRSVIPARAQVEKERIETESRTASGITDSKGKYIAGVVLITAGYSAEGKYSHYLLTQVPIRIGDISLKPGDYVFGFRRNEDSLTVRFYDAHAGTPMGTVEATRTSRIGRVESFHIYAPSDKPLIQIGRFAIPYQIGD